MIKSKVRQHLHSFFHSIDRFIAFILIILIYLFRPMLGPMNICPMVKSGVNKLGCTQYALLKLEKEPVYLACSNIFKRLIACHPFKK